MLMCPNFLPKYKKNRLCSEIIDFAFLIRVLARNENAKIFIVANIILHFTYISLINPSISSPSFQAGLNLTPFLFDVSRNLLLLYIVMEQKRQIPFIHLFAYKIS